MHIYKAAVVGAGTMGAEIAQVIGSSGRSVLLRDIDEPTLAKGIATIRRIYQRQADKGRMSAAAAEAGLSRIRPVLTFEGFEDVDIVIEAVPENMAVKQAVWQELEGVVPETTIFASNTSSLSISEMAAATGRPGKVIGMHFFNPAHVMKLVEVIPGLDTAQGTVEDIVAFAGSLGKAPVVVQECAGFLVNRLLFPYLNEAVYCLQEGAAGTAEIDAAVVEFGMPMGPFSLMDLMGLDVVAHIGEYLHAEYGPRMALPQLLGMMVQAGRLGKKAGKGFYGYGGESDEPVRALVASFDPDASSRFSVERVMYPLLNEAALCLQEHIASLGDIDLAMMAGTNMTYRGDRKGPLAITDEIGLGAVLQTLEQLLARYGERFRPARLLRTKVRAGHLGVKSRRGFYEYA